MAGASAPRPAGVVGAVVAVLLCGACGTATGPDTPGGPGATGAPGGDAGGPTVPTTDDAAFLTVDPPQLTTLDLAAVAATPSATVVVSGGLTFAVIGHACGLPGVRAEGYAVAAQGQFCLVQLEVTNTGGRGHRFTPDRALLLDGVDGVPPSADALVLPPLAAMDTEVPPATTLSGSLVYDVPATDADRELRFDDGPSVRLGALAGARG